MEHNYNLVNRFQMALERNTLRKPLHIYDKNTETSVVADVEREYRSRDVLSSVTKQLDALQTADGTKNINKRNNITRHKRSMFTPVNLLSLEYNQPQCSHVINEFETQSVSDTQFINIIEDAEKVVPPKGMTQEFENSFCEQHVELEKEIGTKAKWLDIRNLNSSGLSRTIHCKNNLNEEYICESKKTEEGQKDIELINIQENYLDKTHSDITPSPIINYIKPITLENNLSPLIYSLDAFENFETLAFSIVENNPDLEAAKHLINSQIIEKELYLGSHIKSENNKIERPLSPVLNIRQKRRYSSNSPKTVIDKRKNISLKVPDKISSENNSKPIDMEIGKYFEDEILFSSDEEDGKELNHQDLSLTCALEPSLYNQHNVLEKTMYVGFQTASNKSILISTESFSKAQSVLEDLGKEAFKPTLTELVVMYEKTNSFQSTNNKLELSIPNDQTKQVPCSKNIKCQQLDSKMKPILKGTMTIKQDVMSSKGESNALVIENQNHFIDKVRKSENNVLNKNYEPVFHTASNKRIRLSENAIAKCQQVFKDIDLDDKFDDTLPMDNKQAQNPSLVQIKDETKSIGIKSNLPPLLKSTTKINNPKEISEEIQLDDQNILLEFENDLTDSDVKKSEVTTTNLNSKENNNYLKCELTSNSVIKKSCLSDMDKLTKQPVMGFKTASNKNINVSDCALMKTKVIFNDFDLLQNFDNVGGVTITPEQDAIKNNVENIIDSKLGLTKHSDAQFSCEQNAKSIKLSSFQTAINKPISISSHALEVSKKLIKDFETHISNNPIVCSNDGAKNKFCGFQTANNKPIALANSALLKMNNFFKDILSDDYNENEDLRIITENDNLNSDIKEIPQMYDSHKMSLSNNDMNNKALQNVNLQAFEGFRTASNKNVKISCKALAKSKKLFLDLEFGKDDEFELQNSPVNKFEDFQTANNKHIKVSSQSLEKSKLLFQDLHFANDNEKNSSKKKTTSCVEPPINHIKEPNRNENTNTKSGSSQKNLFVGFQTASNKQVKVSDQALALSKKILQDLELEDINKPNEVNNRKIIKEENISSKKKTTSCVDPSINQIKEPNINEKINSKLGIHQKNFLVGFQTASNKQVKVSDQALALSKKILQDLELEDINKPNEINNRKIIKEENISSKKKTTSCVDPSINQIKEANINEKIDSKLGSHQKNLLVGFQTASNKQVKVSDQALALSKKILKDLELEDINKPNEVNNGKIIKEELVVDIKTDNCGNTINQNLNIMFKTGNNKGVKVTEKSLAESKKIFDLNGNQKVVAVSHSIHGQVEINGEDHVNVENLFDTQMLNNFEVTMYTEDFCKDTKLGQSKRSGSPILFCPPAKRRKKFEVPCKKTGISVYEQTEKSIFKQNMASSFCFDDTYKKSKKYVLKDLENMEKMYTTEHAIDPYILDFNYETALNFKFSKKRNDLSDIMWTTEDLKKNFMSLVNNKLVPDGWLDNHLRLIIFKLITYERKFKYTMSGICSAKNVLEQLMYRYNRELYNVERPVIRKLLEKDDVPTKTMILQVTEIYVDDTTMTSETSSSNIELLLSDGWYCIKACLDQMLVKLVKEKKITVGTKLAIHGAEMVNCDQGLAPWEDTSRVRLKIFGNSTRRARWDSRLGHFPVGAILTPLSRVQMDGGKVSKMRAFVTRVYPTVYVEKFDDGSTVTRSERLEHLFQVKYESKRQELLEKIYEEVEKEFTHQESQDSECDTQSRGGLDSGSQINRLMMQSKDPVDFRANLTNTQCRLLQDYLSRRREKLLQTVQTRIEERLKSKGLHIGRNVVPVMKIRLADVSAGNISKAMMSIWRPNDAVQDIIKEGMWINMFNVVPTAMRFSELQFSAGRQAIFSRSKYKEDSKLQHTISRLKRTCYSIKDLVQNPAMNTDCNEVDTAGIIFLIDPSIAQFESIRGQLFQNVYLADAEKNIVCVNFWGGLKKFGYENILDTGQVLACMNLQKRAGNTRKSIPQFRATEFSYFTKTPKFENVRKAVDDLNKILSRMIVKKYCEECISKKNSYSVLKYGNGENISPYRMNYSDLNISKHKSYIHSPSPRKSNNLDDILNLSGLDFESTFKQTDTQDLSPSAILRKKKVNEKIAMLKKYGEPPPITPIHIINKSNNATSAFKNPLSSNNDVSSVVNKKKQQSFSTHYNSSPVISSKNSPKRISGNPVKLNFSNNISKDSSESKIDPFAEEFDASPPLSLD